MSGNTDCHAALVHQNAMKCNHTGYWLTRQLPSAALGDTDTLIEAFINKRGYL